MVCKIVLFVCRVDGKIVLLYVFIYVLLLDICFRYIVDKFLFFWWNFFKLSNLI